MLLNDDLTELTDHQMTLLGNAMNEARGSMLRLAAVLESIGSPSVSTIPLGSNYVALIVPNRKAGAVRLALARETA